MCGNGVVTTGEECDDGNFVSGDGCSSLCIKESNRVLKAIVIKNYTVVRVQFSFAFNLTFTPNPAGDSCQ